MVVSFTTRTCDSVSQFDGSPRYWNDPGEVLERAPFVNKASPQSIAKHTTIGEAQRSRNDRTGRSDDRLPIAPNWRVKMFTFLFDMGLSLLVDNRLVNTSRSSLRLMVQLLVHAR